MNTIIAPPFLSTRTDSSKKLSIDFSQSSKLKSSQPASPKKLSRIFFRFVSLPFMKLPKLYGGSVNIRSIEPLARRFIERIQSSLYNIESAITHFLCFKFCCCTYDRLSSSTSTISLNWQFNSLQIRTSTSRETYSFLRILENVLGAMPVARCKSDTHNSSSISLFQSFL